MVTRVLKLASPNRVRRFGEVVRTEGWHAAVKAGVRHARMGLAGHFPSVVGPAAGVTGAMHPLEGVWSDLARNGAFHVSEAPAVHRRRRRVAMIGDLNLPQCRKYRVEQLDEVWACADIGYGYAHYEDIPRCLDLLQSATHLMLYRLGQSDLAEMYLYEARRLRLPVIYDIDDPLFSYAAYVTYGNTEALAPELRQHLIGQSPSYLSVMTQADYLSLSTPGLIAEAEKHMPRPAFLRRNFADRETLEAGRRAALGASQGSGFTLAFASGSSGHEMDLLSISKDLETFLRSGEDRRIRILGRFDLDKLSPALRTRVEMVPFRDYQSYLSALAGSDCAILPLADDAFNRCKSAVRVIDAASVGVPSVVGMVGDGGAMVRDGATGLVVSPGVGGWQAALQQLVDDPGATREMGVAARRDLEEQWSASTAMPIVSPEFLQEIQG